MKPFIELRSDTFTKPTKDMLDAMYNAQVGDDVFGEDPTVNKLQEMAAEMFGMEAGLFCPSGTMTNQIALAVHCTSGEEIICDKLSHIYNYEGGGIAANANASVRLINGKNGIISPEQVIENINPDDVHYPISKLLEIENTVNKGGGIIYSLKEIEALKKVCKEKNLIFHLDGARLFNALVETEENPKDYGKYFDSISICLSKGLGAPIGSILLGNKVFVKKAIRKRKMLGGGMRQAGYLAAAGIYALQNNIERLKIDHQRAKKIADVLVNQDYVKSVISPQTNILIFELEDTISVDNFIKKLDAEGIKAAGFGKSSVRFVTHLDLTEDMIEQVCSGLRNLKF